MNKKTFISLIIVLMCFYGSFLGMADEEKKNSAVNTTDIENLKGFEGNTNTYYGLGSGLSLTTGISNSFFGYGSGRSVSTANDNTFLGYCSGLGNSTGASNVFVGSYAGFHNTTGERNILIGFKAGWNFQETLANIAIGNQAGANATSGSYNLFIGENSGYNNAGNSNIFIGRYSGYSNNSSNNMFLGHASGYNTTTGSNNINIGYLAGYNNTTGLSNVIIGNYAGYTNELGSRNVFLGYRAGYHEMDSDKLYIANSDTINPLIYGDFFTQIIEINGKLGVGITPLYPIHTAGGAYCTVGGVWTNASSRALKENIVNLDSREAVEALNNLNPVKYNYRVDKTDKHVGFIAEDVPELVATADRKGLSAMDVTAVLTKVVQEQQKIIKDLQERLDKLEKK